ncbi:sulfite exporter TauE/SafE family protein [Bacillus suaedaesalsae]|uniref:Probable membrane transporter protein n=1 Tax=Bacillus suaedaesalsae TaxID=2810349 RepID=A0ABS2DG83_9BACI|nr:sulfite exporter TauE/SafE family protein [Bacillus suaedaesalsae]MBM6617040.1 sulfite exporter TauE/SafE family protein [Bacillus suaedaesalsae]
MDIFLFILLGACVGVMSGYFGIGGGFVLTPILLLIGFSPIVAVATSLLYTIGTSLSGIVAHIRMKNIDTKTGLLIAVAGLSATQVAHPFVMQLERWKVEDVVIPVLYILLAGYFSFIMLKGEKKSESKVVQRKSWIIPLLIGFIGGFISTTLGVGGGFIIVPLSIALLGIQPKKAVGTSLFAVFFIVLAGFITYSVSTPIDYSFAFTLIIGAIIGGQIGAYLTKLFKDEEIKRYLGILYISTVINMILQMLGYAKIGLFVSLSYITFLLVMFTLRVITFRKKEKGVAA